MKLSIQDTINQIYTTTPALSADLIPELQSINPAAKITEAPTITGVNSNGLRITPTGSAVDFDK